jgi:FixJ family two-component response regulator
MTGNASPTVFIVDDDAGMRAAIQGLVKTVGLRAESFATPQDFFRRKPSRGPRCLVLDVRLPEFGGLDVQRKLADAGEKIPIIFITGHGDIPMSVKAMKLGAVEFLIKPFRDQDLLDAIQLALQRDQELQQEEERIVDLRNRYGTLTAREREVMGLVVSGMRNKEIASELGTSEITVKVHRGQVMHKMTAASVGELGRMAEILKLPPTK